MFKEIRRIYMALFGAIGWSFWFYVIFIAMARPEGRVSINFNMYNEMLIEFILFAFLTIFFLACLILESIDYYRRSS